MPCLITPPGERHFGALLELELSLEDDGQRSQVSAFGQLAMRGLNG